MQNQRNIFQNLSTLGTNGIRYTGLNGPLAEFLELDKKSGVVTLGKDLFTNGQNTYSYGVSFIRAIIGEGGVG